MKLIPLTKGLFAQVDDGDFESLSKHKWYADSVTRNCTYAKTYVEGKGVRMHRLLMSPVKGVEVDHVDGDGLNNQRANLRVCSHAENARNRPSPKVKDAQNSSGFKGVSVEYRAGILLGYRACIMDNYKQRYLGRFSTAVKAAIAYNRAAKETHGEFAYQNPVEDDGLPLKGTLPDKRVKRSRYRGVTVQASGRIIVYFCTKDTRKSLGTFKTEEEAARRWDAEARLRNYPTHKLNFQ